MEAYEYTILINVHDLVITRNHFPDLSKISCIIFAETRHEADKILSWKIKDKGYNTKDIISTECIEKQLKDYDNAYKGVLYFLMTYVKVNNEPSAIFTS